jgi:hypothetical protein
MSDPKPATRVEPSKSLLQGCEYRNAASTDIKARFERMRAEALDFSGPSLRELKRRKK